MHSTTWVTKSQIQVYADIKAMLQDVHQRPAEEISREMWEQLTPSQRLQALHWHSR